MNPSLTMAVCLLLWSGDLVDDLRLEVIVYGSYNEYSSKDKTQNVVIL